MSTFPDLSLYLVAGRPACRQDLLSTVDAALQGGVSVVQLRDPHADTRQLMEDARALVGLLRPRGVSLIINDRVDVAMAADADGVHLGQDDMTARDARALMGPGRLIGLSVGSSEEVERSRADFAAVDYFGIGPVSGTSTKSDAGAAIGLEGFTAVLRLVDKPAVAIGGLALGSVGPCIRAGAAGVAVVSAICGAEDVAAAAQALRNEIEVARAS